MKFSYSWLKELSGVKLSAEKMAELLTMHSFEVEGVEKTGKDYVLNIDVLPNRAHDCLSHLGVAREVAALSGGISRFRKSYGFPKSIDWETATPLQNDALGMKIRDEDFGARYLGVIVEGLEVKSAPAKVGQRLKTLGVKTINNVVDITNYVMLETGMPLHAFDLDEIQGGVMIIRRARKGERLTTLDGKERVLPEGTLVIQDKERLIDLAGTMGGANTAVSGKTTRIFLQAAVFDPVRIYRSTKQMNFRTEASVRYAAGMAPAFAEIGLARALELFAKEGGCVVGKIGIYPAPQKPVVIDLSLAYVERLLGVKVPAKRVGDILEAIGCSISGQPKSPRIPAGQNVAVTAPPLRLDLQTPEDLIEEIGRVIGYETIPLSLPTVTVIPALKAEEAAFADGVRDLLAAAGMTEAYNYTLVENGLVGLENPMSEERKYLRSSLVPGLIKNAGDNLRFFEEVKMFEIGKVFHESSKFKVQSSKLQSKIQSYQMPVHERWSVGGIIARKAGNVETFLELKGIVDGLFEQLGIPEHWYDDYKATPEPASVAGLWQKGKTAEIKIDNQEVGFLGEVAELEKGMAPPSRKASPGTAVAFELDMEALMRLAREERSYRPLPKYPSVTRDIAILVDASVRIQDVENAIENSGAKYIQDVDLFDIYEGAELGEDRKSLAFHVVYRADDHTLTDAQVNTEHKKIEQALEGIVAAEIR